MAPIISIKNLDVYQRNMLVLKDVNISIEQGEFVYFVGVTGSGKSSLLRMLYADMPIVAGNVEVAGVTLEKLKPRHVYKFRRKLGIVFQDFKLLNDRSVNDNLMFVMQATGWKDKKLMQQNVQDILEQVGLGTKGYKMPHQLSGGEQQRVCIARALINNPEVILADEPTGNLDPKTSEEIMQLLFAISAGGATVVMATHDYLMMEEFPSRKLLFENGKVVEVAKDDSVEL